MKNDVTHPIQVKLNEGRNKKQIVAEVAVTSHCRNKKFDDGIKNIEGQVLKQFKEFSLTSLKIPLTLKSGKRVQKPLKKHRKRRIEIAQDCLKNSNI